MSHRSKFACVLALLLPAFMSFGVCVRVCAQEKPDINVQRPRRLDPAPQNPSSTAADGDVVRVDTDLVNVLFTANDKDKRFVVTLKQEDIRVTEDGVPQEVYAFQRETDRPLSLVILIDVSASQQNTLPAEKAAAHTFVNTVIRPGKDEVGVISFTGEATLEQGLTGSARLLQEAIQRVDVILPPGYIGGGVAIPTTPPIFDPGQSSRAGTTAIWDAVWVTAEDVLAHSPHKTRRAIILLSDGVDTSSRLKRSEAIERAVKADSVIYSIGIGDSEAFEGVDKDTLRKLSERTGGRAFFPKDDGDLRAAFAQIQQELRSQYLLAYSPTNRKKDGSFRQVKIDVANPELRKQKLQLTYRQGYFAKTPGTASLQNNDPIMKGSRFR